jgi:hypothetical protein
MKTDNFICQLAILDHMYVRLLGQVEDKILPCCGFIYLLI